MTLSNNVTFSRSLVFTNCTLRKWLSYSHIYKFNDFIQANEIHQHSTVHKQLPYKWHCPYLQQYYTSFFFKKKNTIDQVLLENKTIIRNVISTEAVLFAISVLFILLLFMLELSKPASWIVIFLAGHWFTWTLLSDINKAKGKTFSNLMIVKIYRFPVLHAISWIEW